MGHDDIFGADFCQPSLTTVQTDAEHAGRTLVDLVLGRIVSTAGNPDRDSRQTGRAGIDGTGRWCGLGQREAVVTSAAMIGDPGLVASFFTLSGAGFAEPPRNSFIERCEAAAAAGFTGIGLHVDDLPRTIAAGVDVVYTATFTATDGFTGTGSVSVAAGSYADAASNLGGGLRHGGDRPAEPGLSVDIVDGALSDGDPSSPVTFTFSEAPVGLDASDITAVGGTVSGLTATSDPLVYTATFTATDGFTGTGSVSVASGSYTDGAGGGTVGTGNSSLERGRQR